MSRAKKPHDASVPTQARPRTVKAVEHAVEILRCISKASAPLGTNEIARHVGLDKSSVSRLLATLQEQHLIERKPQSGGIGLSFGFIALAAPLLADLGIPTIVRPRLEMLAQQSGETVNLSIWDGRESISIVQALGTNAITHYATPGQRNAAHCTASGKVLLAFAPAAEVEAILSGSLHRYTDNTVTEPAALRQQLVKIRATGYAINCGEFAADVGAAATLVRDLEGHLVGALTVTVPMYRFAVRRQQELLDMVLTAAAELSEQLGHRRQ